MPEVIPHWLSKQANLAPDQLAIEHVNGETITFSELKDRSQRFAKRLAMLGVTKGSHVGILSTNNASMIVAIHALSYIGAVSVMLNVRLTKEELTYQLNDADVTVVLTCDSLEKEVVGMDFSVPVKTFSEIGKLEERQVELQSEIRLDDVFTIIYTSGTTGFPKGVMHTYGNHWWSAMGSALNLGIDSKDKWLATLPIFHIGGLSIFIKSVIYGMPVYLVEKFNEQVVHDAIMERGVTIVSVVTVMLKRLVELVGRNHYPDAFRCMLLGGGPAPKPLLEKAKANNIPVFQSYGMTETSSQIVTLSPTDALKKLGSAGKPLFPAQLKIERTKDDPVGEIFVKGPMVANGYFNKEVATTNAFQHGWLATGDLGYLDDDGFLYVVDRRKDLIISGGENIYPTEIESVLSGLEQLSEVGVVGKDDETWGQVPVAFVVAKDNMITGNDVITYARDYLAKYKIPKQVYFVDRLPRNASNKLVRNELVKWMKNN
ncbi:o-succinylbenzoate--CoA ligase [Virgibacillus ndiopensis]|uniref:o-succinylbenzoate--CoA ligase n=1 Tax=Virgibacillus ndiopensis TaxID=2004408 RepID=UPI000C069F6B|nr:o-succinylbenzoate--CoA ligase [Virgibacillus ndiopensis]